MSTSSPRGASTRLATLRATLPRFHATFNARETIRWIGTMVLGFRHPVGSSTA